MGNTPLKSTEICEKLHADYKLIYSFPLSIILSAMLEITSIDEKDVEQINRLDDFLVCFRLSNIMIPKLILKIDENEINNYIDIYIAFIYGLSKKEAKLSEATLNYFKNLKNDYEKNRKLLQEFISNTMEYKNKYLKIENIIYEMLKSNSYNSRTPRQNSHFLHEIQVLKLNLPKKHLDHIIELQVISTAMEFSQNFTTFDDDIIIFLNYFNHNFNLQEITEEENEVKHKKVENYLYWRFSIMKYVCYMFDKETFENYKNHFKDCNGEILDKIRNDSNTTKKQKAKFEAVEKQLYRIINF